MANQTKRKFKSINEMLSFLRDIGKRNKKALQKMEHVSKIDDKKYQNELAAFQKLYGKTTSIK